ncbi:MAG: hypothetical protein K2Q10_00885, partial [Rhodospirillales bacterium]|nr:hypothetical protein [Rhodospirillales bacterium]
RLALMVAAEGLAEQMLATPEIWRRQTAAPKITEWPVVMRGAYEGAEASLTVKRWSERIEAMLYMDAENHKTLVIAKTAKTARHFEQDTDEQIFGWVRLVFDFRAGLLFDALDDYLSGENPPDPLDEIDDFI